MRLVLHARWSLYSLPLPLLCCYYFEFHLGDFQKKWFLLVYRCSRVLWLCGVAKNMHKVHL